MQRILFILILFNVCLFCEAQPKKSRVATPAAPTAKKQAAEKKADRASLMFPTSAEMPEDVVWRRDIYRQLNLLDDKNAPLYYPVEPHGKDQNLFTYLFRLFITGRIPAYQYKLDGNESFEEKDKADVKELLERYSIYYEEKDGKVNVPESDIPSPEVTRYYIKESNYFDQRSATYKTRVTALCPVLMRGADDFGTEATPYPLFWINYDDVATYLSRLPVMASNFNNVTNMTADDYFTTNRYEGKIYKTNNMQGRVLANYCKTDSAMTAEQQRIEAELAAFETGIWHQEMKDASEDVAENVTVEKKSSKKAKKAEATTDAKAEATEAGAEGEVKAEETESKAESKDAKASKKSKESSSRRSKSSSAASTKRPKSSGVSSAPRASARRQRR